MLTRLSMRYINRIVVPFRENKTINFTNYLQNIPPTLGDYKMELGGIFQTLKMICPESQAQVQLTSATEDQSDSGVPVVLDIEATLRIKKEPKSLDHFLEDLKNLRDLKNQVYQTTLTQECHKQFQL